MSEEVQLALVTQRPEITARFPFRKLPPELRNRIYSLHLIMPQGRTWPRRGRFRCHAFEEAFNTLSNPGYNLKPYQYSALSLLGVSRQLYREALGIFYFHNELRFDLFSDLRDFLMRIGPTRRSFIRDVAFDFMGIGSPAAFQLLAGCERLERLHIEVRCDTFAGLRELQHGNSRCLLTISGMKDLLKIRGLKTVDFSYGSGIKGYLSKEQEERFEESVRAALTRAKEVDGKGRQDGQGERVTKLKKANKKRGRAGRGKASSKGKGKASAVAQTTAEQAERDSQAV